MATTTSPYPGPRVRKPILYPGQVPQTGGGGGSPLTTKGDLFTHSSSDTRLPVGADGRILIADSAQTVGLGYSTRTFDLNNNSALSGKSVSLSTYGDTAATNTGNHAGEITNANLLVNLNFTGTITGALHNMPITIGSVYNVTAVASEGGNQPAIRLFESWTTVNNTAAGNLSEFCGFHSENLFLGTGGFGSVAAYQAEDWVGDSTVAIAQYYAVWAQPKLTGTITSAFGFYYAPTIFTGTITNEWSFGATRGHAFFNGLTQFGGDLHAGGTLPSAIVHIAGTGYSAPTTLQASILDASARTVSVQTALPGYFFYAVTGSITATASQGFTGFGGAMHFGETYTLNASLANFAHLDARPSILGSTAPSSLFMLYFNPTINFSGTTANADMIHVNPSIGANSTLTTLTLCSLSVAGNSGTLTTTIGLKIAGLLGTTLYGFQIGNYQSYHQGPMAIGGASNPVWAVDMQLANSALAAYGIASSTVQATQPAVGNGTIQLYKGASTGNFYFLVTLNVAGTNHYAYVNLTTLASGWTATTTTLPT